MVEGRINGVATDEFGHDGFHFAHNSHIVSGARRLYQIFYMLIHFRVVVLAHLGDADLFIKGGKCTLFIVQDLFIQFFSGAQTGIFDLDIRSTG